MAEKGFRISKTPVWKKLKEHAEEMRRPEYHLKHLVKQQDRLSRFSLQNIDFFYDFSRQRVTNKTMDLLFELAETADVATKYHNMVEGCKVNVTENRAALHTAARSFPGQSLMVDGVDVMHEIGSVRERIRRFTKEVHTGILRGSTGKHFRHVVIIGIGGSYLGTEFVSQALFAFADKGISLHFLSNVDSHNFETVKRQIEPEETLCIIISKSFTTVETMANAMIMKTYLKECGLDPAQHTVTVTSKGSPGDIQGECIETFHMFDYIGGRFSVTSAVGGVPLSLALGYERFERFLDGAREMDIHTKYAPVQENIPLVSALIGIWNNNFLGYQAQGIIPYASPLAKLAPHIQQLNMESNGKSVTINNVELDASSGVIIFGEPGTNAQHSFFQLAHQGHPFPIDFIGMVSPQYEQGDCKPHGVSNHQELWANLVSQATALAIGKDSKDKTRFFQGNRPSSTLLLNDLSPANIGRLLSYYEAQTVYKAFIWDINPFDQFGVELGKTIANDLRREIVTKNGNPEYRFSQTDEITRFYLETLFHGKLKDQQ
ncbi:MAG: glucose-6-phosphate isomerase [Desulfobacterales bacterium]|nr:glucose-6-phosphate isomerase [Desulfobacterales bacterium]